ncbi:MAG: hypothetical protein HQM13_09110 [SAR324 cluster bacterium]|nr:hypothetical protein [SAR324 cluster bacterium]
MPINYIQQTRDFYEHLGYRPYQWFYADTPAPWTSLSKPLSKSRLGMISTAGTYVKGQVAYFYKDDTSFRKIPRNTPVADIRFSHVTENHLVEPRKDPNTIFPIQALNQLEKEGFIGELSENFLSCMGGIYSQRRVRSELIPELVKEILEQKIDLLLLVPL